MEIAASSTEYVHIPVTATLDGSPVTLTDPPKIAIIAASSNPATGDWRTGTWAGTNARLLVGPAGGTQLAPGSYWAWVKFTAGTETPVYRAGRIKVT